MDLTMVRSCHGGKAAAHVAALVGGYQMSAAKAFIMGRNMFGPVRGEWDRQWNGWWGDDPPFHAVPARC
jgi:hypothetical protein